MPQSATRIVSHPQLPSRRLTILGATGSIGTSTLKIVAQHPGRFQLAALTAQSNGKKLIALAKTYHPEAVCIGDASQYAEVKSALAPLGIAVFTGEEGMLDAARVSADITIAAIVGAAGLMPTMCAIEQGGSVALANKEALVCAGPLVMQACAAHGTKLLPVDSEHNAIFQVLVAEHAQEVEKITLTASGGPFLRRPLDSFYSITPEEAVTHPRWSMGTKISVDSATMVNKGLELIEAHYLFGLPTSKIEVLIHPQSIVHSLVHYTDGSVLAQLGMPDMAIPIAYTLSWPQRMEVATPRLDLAEIGQLQFETLEEARYPALAIAKRALREGQAHLIAFNAANEVAVAQFLERRIAFTEIAHCVARVVEHTKPGVVTSLSDVAMADQEARVQAREYLMNERR